MDEKILLMSDIHITEPGMQIIGLDPAARFRRCLARAAEHHADAAHLFLMGDLTHHGQVAQYKTLKQCLADQPFPTTLMLGNHDRRRAFAEVFPECEAGFRQGRHSFGDTDVLYLDTLNGQAEDRHSGRLCPDRLDG
jgi:3',5'-cyclic AMP phosphodiesterase CpdA